VPYSDELIQTLPEYCTRGRAIWTTISPLICFSIVEFHRPDRVLRQFRMRQVIPEPCDTRPDLHSFDLRGHVDVDWRIKHREYLDQWDRRGENLAVGQLQDEAMMIDDPYMQWYRRITRRFITRHGATIDYLVSTWA
jgi:hypothetical protein